ncbi:hypothetical protein [Leptolyngbya sp. FACHB-261]|uniref:hypothetical protein n=1 Tax=Leptolyngbya sp. FACHB-261 TaxID=2692806 RepID=UPI0016878231|nr:hypothetical protein [Leptolyngbya sp. FACHB-261]MBD2102253.1 hypothetical protein [Leptolyngbya sp. FACHB-261]
MSASSEPPKGFKITIVQGIIGACSLAGTTAIPLLVQRYLPPAPAPVVSPAQMAPTQAQPPAPTQAQSTVAPTQDQPALGQVATPQLDPNNSGMIQGQVEMTTTQLDPNSPNMPSNPNVQGQIEVIQLDPSSQEALRLEGEAEENRQGKKGRKRDRREDDNDD